MNTEKEKKDAIGSLWATYIDTIDVDLLNLEISMHLVSHKTDQGIEKHLLAFEGVSSFFFVNGEGDSRFKLGRWENAELSEIYYFKTPKDHVFHKHDKPGTPHYEAHPNFSLEIWSTVFLIEAKRVIVDEASYSTD